MKPQVRGIMYITDFACSPEEITRVLGVQPSRSWITGQRVGPTLQTYKSNGWALESTLAGKANPEAHLLELFGRIPSQLIQQLRRIAPACNIQFSLVLEMQDETPPLNLSVDTVQRIASLGASIDVDMYVTGVDAKNHD